MKTVLFANETESFMCLLSDLYLIDGYIYDKSTSRRISLKSDWNKNSGLFSILLAKLSRDDYTSAEVRDWILLLNKKIPGELAIVKYVYNYGSKRWDPEEVV